MRASRAVIAAQRHQLEVLSGTKKQRAADLEGAKATLAAARLKLGYTRIVAPFDGVTGERQVQPGDYVNIGTNLINVVPLPNVYVIANYKETQLTRVKPGQPVPAKVPFAFTTFPGEIWRTPRTWVEHAYPNVVYFNEVERGGHFAAWEEPELFSNELRAAFRPLR